MKQSFAPAPRRWRLALVATAAVVLAVVPVEPGRADPPATRIFGYEAAFLNSRILEYAIDPATSTVTFIDSCVPNPGSANGRGLALGERGGPDQPAPGGMNTGSRVLYNTFLNGFAGDGLIHRNTLPSRGCEPLTPIPFGEGPGGPNQDDIGALDFDDRDDNSRGKGQDVDILYAAGYAPVGGRQILYKVDGESGRILGRCSGPQQGLGGNDTLTYAKLKVGNRTTRVLLTDFGEFRNEAPATYSMFAVAIDSLEPVFAPAAAPPCRIVATYPQPLSNGGGGVITGADYEKIPLPGGEVADRLVATGVNQGTPESANLFDVNGPPFATGRVMGSTLPSQTVEDITVARINPPEEPA